MQQDRRLAELLRCLFEDEQNNGVEIKDGETQIQSLGRRLGLIPAQMTKLLNFAADRNEPMITRTLNPNDARKDIIAPTQEARRYYFRNGESGEISLAVERVLQDSRSMDPEERAAIREESIMNLFHPLPPDIAGPVQRIVPLSEVANAIGATSSAQVSRVSKQFEKDGYWTSSRIEGERRKREVHLTAEGESQARRIAQQRFNREQTERNGETER